MSTIKVNNLESATGGGVAAKLTSVNGGRIGTNNLVVNGAMQIAQRGTSSTAQNYGSLDRFKIIYSGHDEAPTHSQVDVAAGTTPYISGFRKAYKITNGNQTSGAQSNSRIELQTNLEGQDLAQSGWNYVSDSSFITLSFWVKSSVAQTFAGRLQTQTAGGNGATSRFKYNFALNANTWTKITKTVSGNSNLAFTTDNENGFRISFFAFMGTTFTDSSTATDVWADNTGGDRADDMTSTWFTTNDATLEITGVQLEVGEVATAFQFKSFAQELALCQRYYYQIGSTNIGSGDYAMLLGYTFFNGLRIAAGFIAPHAMRTTPSISEIGNGISGYGQGTNSTIASIFGIVGATDSNWIGFIADGTGSFDWGNDKHTIALTNTGGGGLSFSAEL